MRPSDRLGCILAALALLLPAIVHAAGFEVGSNTALANARGGTGIASTTDPSATTFNPGRLAFARGLQVLIGSNAVDFNLRYQRNPLVRPVDVVEYDEVRNVSGPFPVPYLAASWDLGVENLAIGVSVSGPHAYGNRCYSELVEGECVTDFSNAARHMIVGTKLLQIYFLGTASYAFDLGPGKLGVGLSGGPGWQNNQLTLVVDQINLNVGEPYTENPDFQARFTGRKLQDIKPFLIGGLAWEGDNGLRAGAAYNIGMNWEGEGVLDLGLPDTVSGFASVTGDDLVLKTKQAHRLTAGVGYAHGTHPGAEDKPLFDAELNFVWEDWSRVQSFEVRSESSVDFDGLAELPINPVLQPKGYQDTYAVRLGGSWGLAKYLTVHAGGFVETPAQKLELTNADFVSWLRYSGSTGVTVHAGSLLDITLSYAYIASPDREVTDGEVYSSVPLSTCVYPDYDQPSCMPSGTPPGNPQNEGSWHSHFHVAGLNVVGKF